MIGSKQMLLSGATMNSRDDAELLSATSRTRNDSASRSIGSARCKNVWHEKQKSNGDERNRSARNARLPKGLREKRSAGERWQSAGPRQKQNVLD
jgi:hypothetical protein